jgi:divalent metal cation (Fe/Co/Zn/Cd) transporter
LTEVSKTQCIGPEEMLVAAKIALAPGLPLTSVASEIDAAEQRVRERVPVARIIYLEPDLDRVNVKGWSEASTGRAFSGAYGLRCAA